MLFKVFSFPNGAQKPKYVRHESADTLDAISAVLAQEAPGHFAEVCGYDETRAYYLERRLDAFQRLTGRLQSAAQTNKRVKALREAINTAIRETDEAIERIREEESRDTISLLEQRASGAKIGQPAPAEAAVACEIPHCPNPAKTAAGEYANVCESCAAKIDAGESTYLPPPA